MKPNNLPSAADLIFLFVAPIAAITGSVRMTQSDGDLAAHIRMGEVIMADGRIPVHSLASYTASSDFMVAHGWLSEIIFAALFSIGGLPLLSVFTGIVIGLTHALIALFLRKRGLDSRWALIAALMSLALASTHWLTRPHMFSIVGAMVTMILLESANPRRNVLFVPLFALWANLHGGWLYGLTMIGAYIAGSIVEALISDGERSEWLRRARRDSVGLLLASAATLLNRYGLTVHREVLSAVTSSSLASNISEFLAPDFQELLQIPFLLALLSTIGLFALGTRRIQLPRLILILVSVFFALRSYRNIALFGVSAWLLIAMHVAESIPPRKKPFRFFGEFARLDPRSRVGILAIPTAVLLVMIGLNRGAVGGRQLIPDSFSAKAFPTAAVEKARAAGLRGRVFEAWRWGGYIMYAWPEARLHVDPLKFNATTIKSYGIIDDLDPGWQQELDRWQVRTIIINPESRMAKGLAMEPKWKEWYRDSTAVVYRPSADAGI